MVHDVNFLITSPATIPVHSQRLIEEKERSEGQWKGWGWKDTWSQSSSSSHPLPLCKEGHALDAWLNNPLSHIAAQLGDLGDVYGEMHTFEQRETVGDDLHSPPSSCNRPCEVRSTTFVAALAPPLRHDRVPPLSIANSSRPNTQIPRTQLDDGRVGRTATTSMTHGEEGKTETAQQDHHEQVRVSAADEIGLNRGRPQGLRAQQLHLMTAEMTFHSRGLMLPTMPSFAGLAIVRFMGRSLGPLRQRLQGTSNPFALVNSLGGSGRCHQILELRTVDSAQPARLGPQTNQLNWLKKQAVRDASRRPFAHDPKAELLLLSQFHSLPRSSG